MSSTSTNIDGGLDGGLAAGHNLQVLSLTIVPTRPQFPEGTLPDFEVRIQNTGKTAGRLCTYMLKHRLMFAMTAKSDEGIEVGLYPFQTQKWETFKPADLVTLAPGKVHTVKLELSKLQSWAFIRRHDQPPMLTWKYRVPGFAAGTHTFITSIFPGAAIYTGLDGAHDFAIATCRLPEQIPGLPQGDYRDVLRDDATARVDVKFVKKA